MTNQPHILVVEDEPSIAEVTRLYLKRAGYRVFPAVDGAEALHILGSEGPQVVITDWTMPEMSGLDLCRAIRSHEGISFTYVIIVTAHQTSDERLVEAFDAGADDYLSKPYNSKELLARLRAGERIVRLQGELDNRNREVHRYNAKVEIANSKLAVANKELKRMATTDELTGLINRREAMTRLADCWTAAMRHGDPLACITLDIDNFKNCNDTYGHAAGDDVLRRTSDALKASTRREEATCRVGGEEFLVICPRSTEAMAAIGAERLRQAVEASKIRYGDVTLRVTISVGVAERTPHMKTPDDLLRAADEALYVAKGRGRNRVQLAGDTGLSSVSGEEETHLLTANSTPGKDRKPG